MKALRQHDLKCPKYGKTAYISRNRAQKVVDRSTDTVARLADGYGCHQNAPRAYKCQHCGWWHITGKEKRNER